MEINHNKSENELWSSFRNGDNSSFELMYRRYADVLFRYGIQFTSNEALVKDAIHDVYVKLYNDRLYLKTEVNIKFYLFSCLINLACTAILFFPVLLQVDNVIILSSGDMSVLKSYMLLSISST